MTIRRSRILSAFPVNVTASSGTTSSGEVTDSLLISNLGRPRGRNRTTKGSTSSLNIVGSTIVALSSGEAVRASREAGSGPAHVTLRNSIARYSSPNPGADLVADGGTIDAAFSSFTTRLEEDGGTATAPGSASNVAGDPLFVDPGKGDFALQGSSPLIDRGNPGLVGAGELDLAGRARDRWTGTAIARPCPTSAPTRSRARAFPALTRRRRSPIRDHQQGLRAKGRQEEGAEAGQTRGSSAERNSPTRSPSRLTVRITIEGRKRAEGRQEGKGFVKVTTLSGQKSRARSRRRSPAGSRAGR